MKGVVLPAYQKNLIRALVSLRLEEKTLPVPDENEVVIKMYAAPVNPSDIAFMQGTYNIVKTLPSVMGFEGAGTVVDAGKNARSFIGKMVSCFVQEDRDGTWADYVVTRKNNLIVLDEAMEPDQAACFAVNPFTAMGLMEELDCRKGDAVILTAAGGQVPALFRLLAKEKGVETINIVRKESVLEKLKAEGVSHVLLQTEEQLPEKLTELAKSFRLCGAIDAVSGPLAGTIFNVLPERAAFLLYGGLSNMPASGFDNLKVIFNKNQIKGFNLPEWFEQKRQTGEFDALSQFLQQLFIRGTLKTEIRKKVKLEDTVKGIREYIGEMSGGKILLQP